MNELTLFCQQNAIPPALGETWRKRGVQGWTALQRTAWELGLHQSTEHWLVGAPTSAGKGLLAEVATAIHLLRGERALWLVPTRALAQATFEQFSETYGPLGVRVVAAIGDRASDDAAVQRGQFDLLVAVYEKAAHWLLRQPHGLADLGLVVADELTVLRDPERGGRLDVLLTLIQTSPYSPRRIGLSAPAPNLDEVARWWQGRLLVGTERPRPLREGVLEARSGRFRWRDRAAAAPAAEDGEEALAEPEELREWIRRAQEALDDPDWPPIGSTSLAAAALLASRGEPTMLFAPSRAAARHWAAALAQAFELPPPPEEALARAARLAELEPDYDHRLLVKTLARGVGFHHADMSPRARALVEGAFARGDIALLAATPTLSQGVNLAAVNVIHSSARPEPVEGGEGWRRVPLERWRFQDQGGRAARLGFGDRPGRSLLIAWNVREAGRLWRRYLLEPSEPLISSFAGADLAPGALLALAGDVGRTEENLRGLFEATFAGAAVWRERPQELERDLARALAACRAARLIGPSGAGEKMRLTGLGQICAAHGLPPDVMGRVAELIESDFDPAEAEDPLPALWRLALCAPPGAWPLAPRPGASPMVNMVRAWAAERAVALPPPVAAALDRPGGPTAEERAALEASWRLAMWIGPEPTDQVEAWTGWPAGMLARAGEGLAWVAQGAASAGLALGGAPERAGAWRALAARLSAGVGIDGIPLARLRIEGLGRTAIQALCADGLGAPEALADAPVDLIQARVGDAALAQALQRAARKDCAARKACAVVGRGVSARPWGMGLATKLNAPGVMAGANKPAPWAAIGGGRRSAVQGEGAAKPRDPPAPVHPIRVGGLGFLEIDLQSPGVIRVGGRELALTPLTFDLLAALAERPGKVLTREALYQRLWPEGGPEDQQLDAHRRRLTRELTPALAGAGAGVVQNVRGVGFRLNLPEDRVRLRRG